MVTARAFVIAGAVVAGLGCFHRPIQFAPPGSTIVSPRGPDDPPPSTKNVGDIIGPTAADLECKPGDRPGQWECKPRQRP